MGDLRFYAVYFDDKHCADDGDSSDPYDDVLGSSTTYSHPTGEERRVPKTTGSLTWWMSNQDLEEAIKSKDVNDYCNVRFFEKCANLQPKSFCIMFVRSEGIIRLQAPMSAPPMRHPDCRILTACPASDERSFSSWNASSTWKLDQQDQGTAPILAAPTSIAPAASCPGPASQPGSQR